MYVFAMRRPRFVCILAACLPAAACETESFETPAALQEPVMLPSPAGPGSAEPSLSTSADGKVLLSWIEPSNDAHSLRFSVLEADAWSEPRTIASGTDWFVNWADFPSLIQLSDSTLVAHWLQRNGDGTYAYGVRIARSHDGGMTWGAAVTPHDDSPAEHGFVTLYDAGAGDVGAVWLDGRNYAEGVEVMTLRHATIAPDGTLDDEHEIDARVCDCCQTAIAQSEGRLVVFYRDRSEQELRDISMVARENEGWSAPATLHADNWQIDACPVNGPQADARGSHVVIAWFTAPDDDPRVNVAFSSDAGRTFGPPVRVDDGAPAGRVDVLLGADGSAIVSWLERVDGTAEVRLRRVSPEGRMAPPLTVTRTGADRATGFPRMALSDSAVVLAWTATEPTDAGAAAGSDRPASTVRTAQVTLPPPDGDI